MIRSETGELNSGPIKGHVISHADEQTKQKHPRMLARKMFGDDQAEVVRSGLTLESE